MVLQNLSFQMLSFSRQSFLALYGEGKKQRHEVFKISI